MTAASWRDALKRPIFLVSPPRSGSTLLFETLVQSPSLCSIGGESHGLMEGMAEIHPAAGGWESNRLTAAAALPDVVEELSRRFAVTVKDRDGARPAAPLRMLEKTPKNSLRVPFLDAAYPESTFVYLYRDARQTLSSMIEAWRSGRFRTYPRLPGWSGLPWSLLLVPGWRELIGAPLPRIVAHQWSETTAILLDDLESLPAERVRALSYDAFLADPGGVVRALCASLGLEWDRPLGTRLPLSRTTVSEPKRDKWRENEADIAAIWPLVAELDARAAGFAARFEGLGGG